MKIDEPVEDGGHGCNAHETSNEAIITINGQALKQTAAFKYLGSWVHEQGGLDQEIRARVQGIGTAWNNVSGVMYDRRMPARIKKQIYKTMFRPTALYGYETWAVKRQHPCKLEVAEMKCLRAIRGVTRRDRMMNEGVRRDVGVVQMSDKVQESRLRWYGHVRRCEDDEMIKWAADRVEEGKRPRGRPRQRWKDCIKEGGRSIDLELC